jgi:HEAT repeat protein
MAAMALGRIGDPYAVPALIDALKDKKSEVRSLAAWALGAIKDVRAVPALFDSLKSRVWEVRIYAAQSLGRMNDARGIPILIKALGDSRTRKHAALALGFIGDPSVIPVLIQALKDEEGYFKKDLAAALAAIGEPAFEQMNQGYLKGRIPFEDFDIFSKVFNEELLRKGFDKGTVAPPKKPPGNPDEMKRIVWRKRKRTKQDGKRIEKRITA